MILKILMVLHVLLRKFCILVAYPIRQIRALGKNLEWKNLKPLKAINVTLRLVCCPVYSFYNCTDFANFIFI